jgi:hypothetical protein
MVDGASSTPRIGAGANAPARCGLRLQCFSEPHEVIEHGAEVVAVERAQQHLGDARNIEDPRLGSGVPESLRIAKAAFV